MSEKQQRPRTWQKERRGLCESLEWGKERWKCFNYIAISKTKQKINITHQILWLFHTSLFFLNQADQISKYYNFSAFTASCCLPFEDSLTNVKNTCNALMFVNNISNDNTQNIVKCKDLGIFPVWRVLPWLCNFTCVCIAAKQRLPYMRSEFT